MKIKWGVCFSLTKDSLYQTLRSKSYLPLRGNNPRPLDVNFEILTTTPLWYTQWENFKTLYYTKSNSCSDTLLSFHFLGVIRHNFALEFYTHSPEFLGWSIMIKFHHFRNFLIKIFLFNIQSLVIEMFKVINNIAATIIDDLFTTYHSYNLRSKSKFLVSSVPTVHNGQNYMRFSYLEYDSRLYKRFWNFRHIQRQNTKMKSPKLPLLPLQKNLPNLGFINQIWFSVFAYNLVAYNLNVKGYFTLLVDATKMYSVLVDPALRCGFQVLLFENCVIFIFCCKQNFSRE